jgi:hypothetical protein
MNHDADPLWRDLQAMLWFFQGSGGDSQLRILFSNSSPARESQRFQSEIATFKNDGRFDLFMSLATCCIVSNAQSDTKLLHCALQNIPRAPRTQSIDVFPSKTKDSTQYPVISLADFLTVHDHPHILEKAIDNLERLRGGDPSLILGESI